MVAGNTVGSGQQTLCTDGKSQCQWFHFCTRPYLMLVFGQAPLKLSNVEVNFRKKRSCSTWKFRWSKGSWLYPQLNLAKPMEIPCLDPCGSFFNWENQLRHVEKWMTFLFQVLSIENWNILEWYNYSISKWSSSMRRRNALHRAIRAFWRWVNLGWLGTDPSPIIAKI